MDSIVEMFGQSARELFQNESYEIKDGDPARLPKWMRTGALASLKGLCTAYRGRLEVAHGGTGGEPRTGAAEAHAEDTDFLGTGAQTPVTGASAAALLRLGLTVYFSDVASTVVESKCFLAELDRSLGLPNCSTMGAFINAPGSGLPIHHDRHDQLLIQLIGDKELDIAPERSTPHPDIAFSPHGPPPPHFETVYRGGCTIPQPSHGMNKVKLKPGSCLFMPAGTWHQTADQTQSCLSLVVVVRAPSRLEVVLNALNYYGGQSSHWRAPAYGLLDDSQQGLPEALTDLGKRIPGLNPLTLRQCWLTSRLVDGQTATYPSDARFEAYIRLPSTRVSFVSSSEYTIRCKVRCATALRDNVLEFDQSAQVILESILETDSLIDITSLSTQFPDFEETSLHGFVEQLARAGVLRPVPAPDWSK